MILSAIGLLAVMLLLDPSETIDAEAAAAISEDADRVALPTARQDRGKTAVITSETGDYDRRAGVMMFEGHVSVTYDRDYVMCADRVYAFLSGSNEMNRVVALGNVSITNETRVGTCAMATYRRKKSEIEMFGDGKAVMAKLVDSGENASSLEGRRIRFWLDTELVEVEESTINTRKEGEGKEKLP